MIFIVDLNQLFKSFDLNSANPRPLLTEVIITNRCPESRSDSPNGLPELRQFLARCPTRLQL